MPSSKAQQADTADRRKKLIAMRQAGIDFDTIAERLGYASRQAASKDMCRILETNLAGERAEIETLRAQEGERLDRLQAAAWAGAIKGDLKAIDTCAKLIAQRSRLFGLNVPEQLEVVSIDALDREAQRLNRELAAFDAEAGETAGSTGPPG